MNTPRVCSASRRQAFTLIELLVVVAIISLLMSILTPSLSRARQQAKSTLCLTRLHELMRAATAYSGDYNFSIPPMQYEVIDPNQPSVPTAYHGWAEVLYEYLYNDHDFSDKEDFPVQRNNHGRHELFVCKEAQPLQDSTGHYRVYEIPWSKGTIDAVKQKMPLITDGNPRITFEDDLEISFIPRERIAGLEGEAYIDERHYGGANYVFADAHAERSTTLKEKLALDWDLDPETENE